LIDEVKEKKRKDKDEIRTLKRALDVLLCFDWENQKLTMTEIAQKISLAKSTTLRFITALEREKFLNKNEDGSYSLGHTLYYLGMLARESMGLKKAAYPAMQRLRNEYNETVSLFILEDDRRRVCYEQVESTHELKRSARVGTKYPLWAGAGGKAILAFMPEEELLKIVEEIKPLTNETIVDIDELKKQLQEIRQKKIAVSFGEREAGVSAVAAPIFDLNRKVIGSLSIAGPSLRFTKDFVNKVQNNVYEAAKEISMNLGCRNY
jgi:DNA-binding IclR family transcriptional regulator